MLQRRHFSLLAAATVASWVAVPGAWAQADSALAAWPQVLAQARGQTVYWNAWAGDEKTNAFIAWVGQQVKARYGVTVVHTRLQDTSEAVTRVVAEKAAGRSSGGTVDLIWINGPNFLAMKQQGLLLGPITQLLPNFRYVDTVHKRSNVIDFTTPVDGMAVPWSLAQLVFVYDAARIPRAADVPRSAPALLAWAQQHPGRLTHPQVSDFLGATFLKQALVDLLPDPAVLQAPATDSRFAPTTAPLWAGYDQLKPHLWRQGKQFPGNGPAQRQLLSDGEIDITLSFHPAEAAAAVRDGLLPATVRTFTFAKGSIGNTSFVAIPYNAAHRAGALVVANFLISAEAQAHAQDITTLGNQNVLDLDKLPAAERARFTRLAQDSNPALPTAAQLGTPQLEPHASWMTRIEAEWRQRYTR